MSGFPTEAAFATLGAFSFAATALIVIAAIGCWLQDLVDQWQQRRTEEREARAAQAASVARRRADDAACRHADRVAADNEQWRQLWCAINPLPERPQLPPPPHLGLYCLPSEADQ